MTPARLAAIRAIADDERGDPNTRAIAQAKLAEYYGKNPRGEQICGHIHMDARNQPNPRLRKAPEHDKFRFMDMGQWKRTKSGNYTIVLGATRVTLWRRKVSRRWTWVKEDFFSYGLDQFTPRDFETIGDAQRDAWTNAITHS